MRRFDAPTLVRSRGPADTGGTRFGFPRPCPRCGGPGHLDAINLFDRVMVEHCPTCEVTWEVPESACAQ